MANSPRTATPFDPHRKVHCLFGLAFDAISLDQAVQHVRRCADERIPCFISTPNVNWVVAARDDAEFRASTWRSDLCLVDGLPLVWAARQLGMPIHERVAGSDLFERLRRSRQGRPLTVYFFGGLDGVAERAAEVLNAEHGGLRCVGYESPGFGSIESMSGESVIEKINASGADFVIVALGAKRGQAWIERNRQHLSPPLISHLGAVINFVAGDVTRAPRLVRKIGLEWLWRIKEEPALAWRYANDGWVWLGLLIRHVIPAWLSKRRSTSDPYTSIEVIRTGGVVKLRLYGAWTRDTMAPLREALVELLAEGATLQIDLSAVCTADSAFIGLLALIDTHQREPRVLRHDAPVTSAVRRVFRQCGLDWML